MQATKTWRDMLDESLEPFERDAFRAQKCREFFRCVTRAEL